MAITVTILSGLLLLVGVIGIVLAVYYGTILLGLLLVGLVKLLLGGS